MAVRSQNRPIIIRKLEPEADHGHHGGAWKVAYADFMTAMMAFFLLMWIVSNASKDQLNGLADYFTPATVSMTAKGGSGALGGTTMGPKGVMNQSNGVSKPQGMESGKPEPDHKTARLQTPPLPQMTDEQKPAAAETPAKTPAIVPAKAGAESAGQDSAGKDTAKDSTGTNLAGAVTPAAKAAAMAKLVAESHARDDARFKAVEHEITQAMQSAPDLRPLLKNVIFEKTPEGLRIQIVDQNGKAMFASGSAKVAGPTLALMQSLGKAISGLPNKIRISGHTDAVPYAEGADRDNWELSSERANAVRRVFLAAGVEGGRVRRISGLADTDPLNPANPRDPRNRRISVLLSYDQAGAPPSAPPGPDATVAGPAGDGSKAPVAVPVSQHLPQPTGEAQGEAQGETPVGTPRPERQAEAKNPIDLNYAAVTLDDLRKAGH